MNLVIESRAVSGVPCNPHVAALPPYNAGLSLAKARAFSGQDSIARLASNENPEGCSPAVIEALASVGYEPWRYADPACTTLREALGQRLSVDPDRIVVGNGSEELIAAISRSVLVPGDAVARLRAYAASKGRFEIHIFEGAFEDNLNAIAAKLIDGFTFTFIDPTGWNIRNEEVFRFLREQNGEFMLNFMSDHINRHAEYQEVAASFARFLADPQWAPEFARLPADWSNERKMLHLVKTAMRANKVASYLPDFSIMVPRRERVKMRLILGTHSPSGLEVFRDVQEKVEKQELEMRNNLREGDSPQVSLFSSADIAAIQQEQKGVGCKANRVRAEEIVLDFLRGRTRAFPGPMYNLVMENVAIRRTHLNKVLIDMRARGIVSFELPPRKQVPQPDTAISLS